ncbi:MAG: replicative DNA helicase, partial [Bacillota bacterium]|nr:replicative DNA helicase [Bacillota bacterium]
EYAKIVKDKAVRRSVISLSAKLSSEDRSTEMAATEILEAAESEIYELGQESNHSSLTHIAPVVADAYDNLGKEEDTISTYFDLDGYLGGLHKSDVIIVAARPGMGKTTFCINLAVKAALESKKSVAFFSLEMSSEQLATRMLVSTAKVNTEHVKNWDKITDAEMKRLSEAMAKISAAPLYLDDTPNITVAEIRGKVRRLKKEKGLDLIVIDYIGLMQASAFLARSDNRQQQISEISRQIKGMAKELDLPIIVISQLNRTAVKGDNSSATKEPDLSHLRESGALEQDADIVLFIHRPAYYNPEAEDKTLAKVIIAKHRNGAVGRVDMTFISDYTLFTDREKKHPEEGEPIPPEELAGYVVPEPPPEKVDKGDDTPKPQEPQKEVKTPQKDEGKEELDPMDELPF